MEVLDRLLEHDQWATTYLLDVSRGLTDTQFDKQFDIGHGSLHETFGHMIFNVEFWTAVMTGQEFDGQRDDYSLAALTDWHEQSYETFATFSRRVRDEQRLDDTFVDHFDQHMTYGGAILHVILHNAEHRTEVLHILNRLHVPDVPELDHGLWDFVRRGLYQPG
jgi:uncharacterized damage-inducible protein DinB